jgi:arylsulfatase A-like enzyme
MDRVPSAPRGRKAFLDPRIEYWNVPLIQDEKVIQRPADQNHLTQRYTREAVRFIRAHQDRPFFLYFAHTFPHVPLFASEQFHGRSRRGLFGDAVEELDWSVGQVLDTLRQTGLDRRTLVFFTSDNGPWLIQGVQGGSAGLLREGKGSTWEGGMREPAIAWWPGRVRPGVCRALAATLDFLPTAAERAGAELPTDRVLDGVSLLPLLNGNGPPPRDSFIYYRGTEIYAARKGRYKAHFITRPAYGRSKPERHDPPVLYDLDRDPSEQYNVAAQHPDVIAEIQALVARHRATVKPVVNQLELTAKKGK